MDCIRAPDRGNRVRAVYGRTHAGVIEPIRQREPLTRSSELVTARRGVASVETGAEGKVAQIIGSGAGDVGLDNLSDFLLERHPRQHCRDTRLQRRIRGECRLHLWPAIRMYPGIGSTGRLKVDRKTDRGGYD